MLVSRSMNEDVCPRKVLPYILMGLSPATFCSFSRRVINNNPCLLLPAALGWLCSHPALTHTHTFISWDSAARRGWGSSGIFHSCGKGWDMEKPQNPKHSLPAHQGLSGSGVSLTLALIWDHLDYSGLEGLAAVVGGKNLPQEPARAEESA